MYDGPVDLQLAGKTAIVTGGSRGIGKAIALQLAQEGVDVAIVARGAEALKATAEEIAESTGARIVPVVVDTASTESVKNMVAEVMAAFGHVDILINGASNPGGSPLAAKITTITDELFFDDVNVKVMGYMRCAREVAPRRRCWAKSSTLTTTPSISCSI